jgi:hypothetical protein
MIRLSKPVQLLEWGEGSNTTNQNWVELGNGNIVGKPKTVDGITTIIVQLNSAPNKKNQKDDTIKVQQAGEGMTPHSSKNGEVAYCRLKKINGATVEIETRFAIKYGK